MGTVNLTDVIAPAFYGAHWDILEGKHTYYDLFGGRGSTKSSFIGTEIPLGMSLSCGSELTRQGISRSWLYNGKNRLCLLYFGLCQL